MSPARSIDGSRRFVTVSAWLLAEVIRQQPGRVALALVISVIGILLQFLTYGTALLVVHVEANQTTVDVLGLTFQPVGTTGLVRWGLVVFGLASTSALAIYGAEELIYAIARRSMLIATRRIIRRLSAHISDRQHGGWDDAAYRELLTRGYILGLRGTNALLHTIIPVIIFVIAGSWMVWAHPTFTLIFGVAMILYIGPFLWINRSLARAALARDQRLGRGEAARSLIQFFVHRPPPDESIDTITDRYIERANLTAEARSLRGILMPRRQVAALQGIFVGTVLATLLILVGMNRDEVATNWTLIIAYLIGFRYVSMSMTAAARSITSVSRFLPTLERYVEFCRAPIQTSPRDRVTSFTIEVGREPLAGSEPRWTAKPGDCVVCTPVPSGLDRRDVGSFLCTLMGCDADAPAPSAAFIGSMQSNPYVTPRELLTLPTAGDDDRLERARAFLRQLELADPVAALPDGLDTALTKETCQELSPHVVDHLTLIGVILDPPDVVVIPGRCLDKLPRKSRPAVYEALDESILIVVRPEPGLDRVAPADRYVVIGRNGVRGIGDGNWFGPLASTLQQPRSDVPTASPPSDELDDEDDL